jgi:DNA-binding NarL/FixJ family response regulator
VAVTTDCGPIFIVDEDARSREFLVALLRGAGYEQIVEFDRGEEALIQAGIETPALVLLEIELPGMSGYEVCHQLRARLGEHVPIVFVSETRAEPHDRVAGLLLGADDFVVKPFFPGELVARIRRRLLQANGERATDVGREPFLPRLTEREMQILRLLAEGYAQEAIARQLYISPRTVATHIQHILTKLGVRSRAEAVAAAYRHRLVETAITAKLPE